MRRTLLALALLLLLPQIAHSEDVDLMLVLAADNSLSMDAKELQLQRMGYADALSHEQIYYAIEMGDKKKIAITYVEWSSADKQKIVIPWTKLETQEDLDKIAALMRDVPIDSGQRTAIGNALLFSSSLFDASEFKANRKVIDVSGDGPSNTGLPLIATRDMVVAKGITINGLAIMPRPDELWQYILPPLDAYYDQCVIGGEGAFSIPINGFEEIEMGLRMKLIREIANLQTDNFIMRTVGSTFKIIDCLAFE